MINDILYYSNEYYLNLPIYSSGVVSLIEANTQFFLIRLSLPERINISLSQTSVQTIINR